MGGGREALGAAWPWWALGQGGWGGVPSFLLPLPGNHVLRGTPAWTGLVRTEVYCRHSLHPVPARGGTRGLAGLAESEALALGEQHARGQETLPKGPSCALWAGSLAGTL